MGADALIGVCVHRSARRKAGVVCVREQRFNDSPQRTIGTGQQLYQRFHLFYSPSDFSHHEVALASLFTSAKMNDTQKRVHDVLLASYALRYPDMLPAPSSSAAAGDWVAHAHVADADVDAAMLHQDQSRLLALERLLLQTACFNFRLRAQRVQAWVIKLARRWALAETTADLAWRAACDSHRTSAPLIYPPQTVAIGAILAALALLHESDVPDAHESSVTMTCAAWETLLSTSMDDAEDVALYVLHLYAWHVPGLAGAVAAHATRRSLPPHVVYPPPLGLLVVHRRDAMLVEARVTHAQIRIRQQAQTRPAADGDSALGKRKREARILRMHDELPATMYTTAVDDARSLPTRYLL